MAVIQAGAVCGTERFTRMADSNTCERYYGKLT